MIRNKMNCNYEGTNCKFCEIDCNATEGLEPETIANKNNQLHNNTDEELLKQFIELRERFQPLYRETGLISIENGGGIHLTPEMFLEIFGQYNISYHSPKYPTKLTAKYNGVEFFCIR